MADFVPILQRQLKCTALQTSSELCLTGTPQTCVEMLCAHRQTVDPRLLDSSMLGKRPTLRGDFSRGTIGDTVIES